MITPFSDGGYASGVAALLIGAAFGWFLERAGMGSARKLAGQFYLTDLTVFKVMFTAIVTAMLGVFWLGWIGAIDTTKIYVPETFLIPQIVGGVVFGIGFAIAGLCPGTSCVAAATGRIDGFAVVAGMFTGVLGSGILFASLRELYDLTPRGVLTLPQIFGVSEGLVVFAVVLIAMAGFKVANRIEARSTAA